MTNPFWGNIFHQENDPHNLKTEDFLVKIPLFANLTRKEAKKVANIVHERIYQEGEFMFKQGHPGAAMFIIKTGVVDIVLPRDNAPDIQLAQLGAGSFLGELALLDDSPRSASAMIKEEAFAYAFFRTDLNKLIETDPGVGSKILKELALIIGQRLKATNVQLTKAEK